jgi:hypothetical protein
MKFEVQVTRRVVDGDEFGPCEYVLSTSHPDGNSEISTQDACPGKAFRQLLTDFAVETIQVKGF